MPFLAPIGYALGVGTAATATAAATGTLAASLVGAAVVGTVGSTIYSGIKSSNQKAPEVPSYSQASQNATGTSSATPSFEQAQATSIEEQRKNLRRRTKTVLTSPNMLETAGATSQKTLLGA